MRRIAIFATLVALSAIAACADKAAIHNPAPTPRATEGGYCGDGTVIRPPERCP